MHSTIPLSKPAASDHHHHFTQAIWIGRGVYGCKCGEYYGYHHVYGWKTITQIKDILKQKGRKL